jgi:iron complex transport system ATP-binding protein
MSERDRQPGSTIGPVAGAGPDSPATAPVLAARGLFFSYVDGVPILAGLDLDVAAGAFLGIVGPNGAGKSTLLHLLSGALSPDRGEVSLLGRPLKSWRRREAARKIAVVPQSEPWTFAFRVEEVVLMGRTPYVSGIFSVESDADREVAHRALEAVGISGLAGRALDQLSGGERQMVLVARALAQEPGILLLDEPTTSLDLAHQQQIFRLLGKLNAEQGLTVVTVTHDLNLAALFCEELAVLHEGRIAARGMPESIMTAETLGAVYGAALWTARSPGGTPIVGLTR